MGLDAYFDSIDSKLSEYENLEDAPYFTHTRWARSDYAPRDVICVRVYPSVRAIKELAFNWCLELRIVILGKGLKEIRVNAFAFCRSLCSQQRHLVRV